MTRFVIDSGTTIDLAGANAQVPSKNELYAPTLWRSETLSALYEAVRRGDLTADDARERIAYVNGLKIRLLGDAVLRRRAWQLAEQLDFDTTYEAEYVALALLQKCTLVSNDPRLVKRVRDILPTASVDELLR